jgi:DNA-binding transcriptional regulator GbsR (MarR family)
MKRHVTVLIGSAAGSNREVQSIINIRFMSRSVISLSDLAYQIQITITHYSSGIAEMVPRWIYTLS